MALCNGLHGPAATDSKLCFYDCEVLPCSLRNETLTRLVAEVERLCWVRRNKLSSTIDLGIDESKATGKLQQGVKDLGFTGERAARVVSEAAAKLKNAPVEVVLDLESVMQQVRCLLLLVACDRCTACHTELLTGAFGWRCYISVRGVQIAHSKQQQVVQPAASTLVVFYLALELLITRQLTNVFFTEAAALFAIDAVTKPWACAETTVRVSVPPEEGKKQKIV